MSIGTVSESVCVIAPVQSVPRKVLLGVLEDGVLGVVGFGADGLDTGFLGAEGLGLTVGLVVVRGGKGT